MGYCPSVLKPNWQGAPAEGQDACGEDLAIEMDARLTAYTPTKLTADETTYRQRRPGEAEPSLEAKTRMGKSLIGEEKPPPKAKTHVGKISRTRWMQDSPGYFLAC